MRKSKLVVLFTALSITACITCLNGCGKQGVEPVMAATIETLTSEPAEEESVIATEEETESIEETTTDEAETESVTVQDFTITEMNKEMQATQNALAYEEPNTNLAISALQKDEIVTVTGIVDGTDWYRIIGSDNIESFIDSKYLKEIEQQQQQAQNNNQEDNKNNDNNNNQQQQPKVETPKENPQPPVVNPPAPQPEEDKSGGAERLPDGGIPQADGSVVYPGDVVAGGSIVVTGIGEDSSNWW